ncbi:TRAP transporter small permease [Tropicimonas sediminicola]|uniref:TRAP transporter small permease protein n=1 Tax=Tropicimonas sediminicola TaxID=1031541 RepID=A0A239D6U2_9RHOB|nr:TRAP transporter small permease [Tropicimonas sediminicola]SNS28226.1 TRAP-type C4-dicarboxylate transport system, small permease component [Tropicimonas sediminicola]
MNALERLTNLVSALCKVGVGLSFALLIVVVLVQVIGRTTGASPVWTEEMTRFALLYLAAFGVGLSFRSGDLVNVDVICENLPEPLPWVLRLVSAILTAAVALILIPHAWKFTSIGKMQTSPAMGIRMDLIHFTVTLLLAMLFLFAALRVINMLAGRSNGLPLKAREED